MKRALLIGGTAASGIAIVEELRSRGFEITLYHRGSHEVPQVADLEHIHGDPHFAEAIERDLGNREWDITVATYGRIRLLAQALKGRTGHFVAVGGVPAVQQHPGLPYDERDPQQRPEWAPPGLSGLLPRIIATENAVLEAHAQGEFVATLVRYPYVYGPHSVVSSEWHVLRRVLDDRRRWIIQGGGLAVLGRCAAPNAGRLIGRIVDNPAAAGGEIYHAADSRQYSQREWVEMVAAAANYEFEFVDIPTSVAPLGRSSVPMSGDAIWNGMPEDISNGRLRHSVVSSEKARRELAYEDAVSPQGCLAATVEYLLENPPGGDGGVSGSNALEFDYGAEDALLKWWDSVIAQAPSAGAPVVRTHAYDHPKDPQLAP